MALSTPCHPFLAMSINQRALEAISPILKTALQRRCQCHSQNGCYLNAPIICWVDGDVSYVDFQSIAQEGKVPPELEKLRWAGIEEQMIATEYMESLLESNWKNMSKPRSGFQDTLPGWVIAPRDFVSLAMKIDNIGSDNFQHLAQPLLKYFSQRGWHFSTKNSLIVVTNASKHDNEFPPLPGVIRGTSGPSGWLMTSVSPESDSATRIHWLMNVDSQIPKLVPTKKKREKFGSGGKPEALRSHEAYRRLDRRNECALDEIIWKVGDLSSRQNPGEIGMNSFTRRNTLLTRNGSSGASSVAEVNIAIVGEQGSGKSVWNWDMKQMPT
ncbi:unnamed protein product [Notodromas monacha]|uniref:START domain-containing protein n=1 Tax=Notodromas monacha TaxID=399045 RepID=A0A7R9BY08_9CRUS|nr:unnamed protein product [Notodromas monacha]CAG0922900.1 unnamed protein product [Notodromas monacha]